MKKIFLLLFLIIPFIGFSQTDTAKTKKPVVFSVVEKMPQFKGGDKAMFKFIGDSLKYPKSAREKGIEGLVVVQFIIDKKGNVTKAKVLRDIGAGCGKEALRIVNIMPKWIPGTQRGKPVNVQFNLPIRFKLD